MGLPKEAIVQTLSETIVRIIALKIERIFPIRYMLFTRIHLTVPKCKLVTLTNTSI